MGVSIQLAVGGSVDLTYSEGRSKHFLGLEGNRRGRGTGWLDERGRERKRLATKILSGFSLAIRNERQNRSNHQGDETRNRLPGSANAVQQWRNLMKRFMVLLVALVASATLTLTSAASAAGGGHGGGGHGGGGHGGGHGGSGHGGSGHGSGHGGHAGAGHGSHGQGHRSMSRSYRGWTRYCWFPSYGCYGYYCPDDGCWYYWYGPDDSYRPVSDMAGYPPDKSTPPSLPPGATSVP